VTEARATDERTAPKELLELDRVSRSFGSTRALDEVSFSLRAGEVHVLSGENGAGKSTLIRILSGADQGYSGVLRLSGLPVRLPNPRAARRVGIATIHQELSLLPNLSAAENLLLADEGRPWALVQSKRAVARARDAFSRLGLELDPEIAVERLALGERQLVEIARALDCDARLVIMDEPTSALTDAEAERLFRAIDRLRASGAAVLYISHRMEEIARLADRISVLRDGKLVRTAGAVELTPAELVEAMLGRPLEHGAREPRSKTRALATPRLAVHRVSLAAVSSGRARTAPLEDVTFELAAGEIVGLTGLSGSGADRVLAVLSGAARRSGGSIALDGERYEPREPRDAYARGVVFLPNDRRLSVLPNLRLFENATLSSLPRHSPLGLLRRARELSAYERGRAQLRIKASGPRAFASELSGGNQQKLALLRCLVNEPRLFLLDDPTRGVDVGARADIHALLRSVSKSGVAVLVHATDLEELASLCDRVLVFRRGRIVSEASGDELTRERILAEQSGGEA
jgi:ABC-type sugar transport system ATPase subunit